MLHLKPNASWLDAVSSAARKSKSSTETLTYSSGMLDLLERLGHNIKKIVAESKQTKALPIVNFAEVALQPQSFGRHADKIKVEQQSHRNRSR